MKVTAKLSVEYQTTTSGDHILVATDRNEVITNGKEDREQPGHRSFELLNTIF